MKILRSFQIALLSIFIFNNVLAQTTKISPCIPCEELKNLSLPDVKITSAALTQDPVPHCKVSGIIGTEIKFELLLPNHWNSRFIMSGGSGFAGSVMNYFSSSINKGYAMVTTDTGHEGHNLKADWALYNMERQINFGHLAVHRVAVTSKEIIGQYYGSEITYSYFRGGSRGGGQGMMEAQRYPEDFDGIVAGAPGFIWPALGAKIIQICQAVFPDPDKLDDPIVTLANIELLNSLILLQCDELDGIKDSILNDPRECKFDFDQLPRCANDHPSDDCFKSQQIEAIKIIYSDLIVNDKLIYPGYAFGCENEVLGWQNWITGPTTHPLALDYPSIQYALGTEIFKYLIFQDSTWDYSTYNFTDFSQTTKYASAYLDATSTDYSKFKNHGGKMIIYHGWNDWALSPFVTINHYEQVKKEDADLKNYIRLFLIPGMLHSSGGPGPDQADWIEVISNWVEKDLAPERVVMSKLKNNKVILTRPVFPYPEISVYDRKGDPRSESSFRSSISK